MNTRKQVLIMSTLLASMLVLLAIYAAWNPSRETSAETSFQNDTANRGAILFSQNCRLCHGDVAQGGALGGRLPAAPALNRPDLQGFGDSGAALTAEVGLTGTTVKVDDGKKVKVGDTILIDQERMKISAIDGSDLTVQRAIDYTTAAGHFTGAKVYVFSNASLTSALNLVTNTITCGRVGTAMPAWSDTQGGPLNSYQITQLATLITQGRWDLVAAEDDTIDLLSVNLTAPVTADATQISVSDITLFTKDQTIRLGNERLQITAVPDYPAGATGVPGKLTVDRGVLNSFAAEHSQDTPVYNFPQAPSPSINKQSCGQTAQAPAPAGSPATVTNFTGQTVDITAQNIKFDKSSITVNAGGKVRIHFTNKDAGVQHNFAVYKSSSDLTPVADGSVGVRFEGSADGVQDDIVFDVPDPGTYYFRCDVHPTIMFGTFTVK